MRPISVIEDSDILVDALFPIPELSDRRKFKACIKTSNNIVMLLFFVNFTYIGILKENEV